jgi:hypothetical protein
MYVDVCCTGFHPNRTKNKENTDKLFFGVLVSYDLYYTDFSRKFKNYPRIFAWQSSVSQYLQFGMKSVENTDKSSSKAVSKFWLWAGIAQSV